MKLYKITSLSGTSNAVVAAPNEDAVRDLFKYNYSLSDGNIIEISHTSIYKFPAVVSINQN